MLNYLPSPQHQLTKAECFMVVAALIFGILVLSISLLFLLVYVRNNNSMRESQSALARRREQQLKFQADLQARMESEGRKYEEARQALLRQTSGTDRDGQNIEHAA
jgi:phage regulator Rha-like protein